MITPSLIALAVLLYFQFKNATSKQPFKDTDGANNWFNRDNV